MDVQSLLEIGVINYDELDDLIKFYHGHMMFEDLDEFDQQEIMDTLNVSDEQI